MLENGDSNLQTKFGKHITSNIFKIIQFKNHRIAPIPLTSQLWKLTQPRGIGGRFKFCFAKMNGRDEIEGTRSNLPLGSAILSTRAKTVWGVVATPLRRTRVKPYQLLFGSKRCLNKLYHNIMTQGLNWWKTRVKGHKTKFHGLLKGDGVKNKTTTTTSEPHE